MNSLDSSNNLNSSNSIKLYINSSSEIIGIQSGKKYIFKNNKFKPLDSETKLPDLTSLDVDSVNSILGAIDFYKDQIIYLKVREIKPDIIDIYTNELKKLKKSLKNIKLICPEYFI